MPRGRWKKYFEELMSKENETLRRKDRVNQEICYEEWKERVVVPDNCGFGDF